jgi:hypothetical protein
MHEALRECSIPADTLQDAAIPTSNPNSMLESSCGVVGFHSNLIPAGTSDSTHNADFPVIPLQEKKCIMPVEIEIFGGLDEVEEDNYMDSLIEYPLRHSPECVLLRPVPGAKTHPDYVFKK